MADKRAEEVKAAFEAAGQGHVFANWDGLSEEERARLLVQAREIDLKELQALMAQHLGGASEEAVDLQGLEPAPYVAHPRRGGDPAVWASARAVGEAALRAGRVGAFTVAGGQGTRLGYDGPKGTFPVTPVKKKPLFQVFAEKIRAASLRYGVEIPWFIMTSHANHEATQKAFQEAGFYGLKPEQVSFFMQGRMPAVDLEGKVLLEAKDSIAMSPDGHGGSLRALVRSGAVKRMREVGVEALSYFQVDNPLIQVIDPAFIGFHLKSKSEMSSKMIPKAYPGEKVGHFCRQGDRTVVIEYSDMPETMQAETAADGRLRYIAGSIAIHILDVGFVERMGGDSKETALPFHRALKKVPFLNRAGQMESPEEPNGIKFEMFVFDAVPFAKSPVIIETLREDDFSPVKNAQGIDSPETSRDDQLRQFARWARAAGVDLPVDGSGKPSFAFEVSPLFADSEDVFVERWRALPSKPELTEGTCLE